MQKAMHGYKLGTTQYIKSNTGKNPIKYLISKFYILEMTSRNTGAPHQFYNLQMAKSILVKENGESFYMVYGPLK